MLNPPVKGKIPRLYAAQNKGTTILYQFMFQKSVLNPPVTDKIQGLFMPLSVFQVLFKANLIFKDFSGQLCIFKYFSSLCEPCIYKTQPKLRVLSRFMDYQRAHAIKLVSES